MFDENGKTGFDDFVGFVEKSMLRGELDKAIDSENVKMGVAQEIKQKRNMLQNMRTPLSVCEKYLSLTDDGGSNYPINREKPKNAK